MVPGLVQMSPGCSAWWGPRVAHLPARRPCSASGPASPTWALSRAAVKDVWLFGGLRRGNIWCLEIPACHAVFGKDAPGRVGGKTVTSQRHQLPQAGSCCLRPADGPPKVTVHTHPPGSAWHRWDQPPPPAALEPADRGPCLRTQLLLNGPYGFPRGHWITVY